MISGELRDRLEKMCMKQIPACQHALKIHEAGKHQLRCGCGLWKGLISHREFLRCSVFHSLNAKRCLGADLGLGVELGPWWP